MRNEKCGESYCLECYNGYRADWEELNPSSDNGTTKVEKTETFTVMLHSFGANKIQVIKAVRELSLIGLKEAKDLVERAISWSPEVVCERDNSRDALRALRSLQTAGATATVTVRTIETTTRVQVTEKTRQVTSAGGFNLHPVDVIFDDSVYAALLDYQQSAGLSSVAEAVERIVLDNRRDWQMPF